MRRGSFPLGWVIVILSGLLLAWMTFASLGKPYSVGDKEEGEASWYGQGAKTASGEIFDPHQLTAAHRHLPFGSLVRVTNRSNGRSVEVRINDRGPWRVGRIIDVSAAAADILQMKNAGEIPVVIQVLRLGAPESKR